MELKQIKELMVAMEKASVKKLTIKEKSGFEIHLERQDEFVSIPSRGGHIPEAVFSSHPPPSRVLEHDTHAHALPGSPQEEKKQGKYVTSPMVGTFYASPSPEDSSFVKVGDAVTENTVVCIIEAMKVMNEVKAGIAGVVAEVCVESGHPVEFGTKLLRIV